MASSQFLSVFHRSKAQSISEILGFLNSRVQTGSGSPEHAYATEKPVTWGKAEIAGVSASQTKNRWARTIFQVAFAQGFVIFNQMGKEINTSTMHPLVRSETYPSANSFPPQDYRAPLRAMANQQQQLWLTSCAFILYGRKTPRGC